MVDLTSDEQAKILNLRKSPKPEYFNAQSGLDTQISDDFESFLILQDAATITASLTWLAITGLLAQTRFDRDSVAFEALVMDSDDRERIQDEIKNTTLVFNTWKELFQAGKFSDVPEVGLIIEDMQSPSEELFVLEERMKHLEQVQKRVNDRIRKGVSDAQLRQLQSWPNVLLAY